ncbi:biotin/lipoyl attachment protein [Lunatimonas lonarensis]|uniref:Biotin/lipoyl attachment protein n=1 Tax=Lunatimonas lonarensis TaxID=1232681 RepID=R7ZN27_9BACT|nr:acetyl-CoA carboxylase biotin carboxyl carrier protein subunit [Lunatimonas lonarensis]EON75482.1 biotin/lipoyl attachment protein [Lunatimonas lonarensis]
MYKVTLGKQTVSVESTGNQYTVEGSPLEWDIRRIKENHFHILYKNRSLNLEVIGWDEPQKILRVKLNGRMAELEIKDPRDLLLEKLGIRDTRSSLHSDIKAPMPGLILKIPVTIGQSVAKGDTLLVLEAMKMENVIKSPQDGTIKAITVSQGQSVEKNQLLVQF